MNKKLSTQKQLTKPLFVLGFTIERASFYQAFLLLILFFIQAVPGHACSMYKITENGKTIVGNNEDWISPNSQFWFEPGDQQGYGVMYMGLLDNFAQGAINEAGLVFDGFGNPYLEVKNTAGKIDRPIGQVVREVMQTMDNVRDVKKYFSTINLGGMAGSMLVFVDRTGEYLIIEGDELIVGKEAEKTFSNFYYSQIQSIEEVELLNVQNGLQYLQSTASEGSVQYCGSVMNALSNPDQLTQYSTIYDLEALTVSVYLYHDFTQSVEIDLKEELGRGTHRTMIAELFPKNSIGYLHYAKYNNEEDPTEFLREWTAPYNESEDKLVRHGFAYNLNWVGYEWLLDKNNPQGAIAVFTYATALMPSQANLFDSLGEAYLANENYEEAIKSYAQSLILDPSNDNAIQMLERARTERNTNQ